MDALICCYFPRRRRLKCCTREAFGAIVISRTTAVPALLTFTRRCAHRYFSLPSTQGFSRILIPARRVITAVCATKIDFAGFCRYEHSYFSSFRAEELAMPTSTLLAVECLLMNMRAPMPMLTLITSQMPPFCFALPMRGFPATRLPRCAACAVYIRQIAISRRTLAA